jgi:hypothetical protein
MINVTRNILNGAQGVDTAGFTALKSSFFSAQPINNNIYNYDYSVNVTECNDTIVLYGTFNIGQLNGYFCTIEHYLNVTDIANGVWDYYSRLSADSVLTNGLRGYDYAASVGSMLGSQPVNLIELSFSCPEKELGQVSILNSSLQVTYTDGGTFVGFDVQPGISGTAVSAVGFNLDMSSVTATEVKGFVAKDSNGTSEVNFGSIKLLDSSNNPAIPTLDEEVTTKKYVDDKIQNATIASATDPGVQGQICWDNDYIYVCIATDTWKRTPITTW